MRGVLGAVVELYFCLRMSRTALDEARIASLRENSMPATASVACVRSASVCGCEPDSGETGREETRDVLLICSRLDSSWVSIVNTCHLSHP